jgi:hypothetical protein
MELAGYSWLIKNQNLKCAPIHHHSQIGTQMIRTETPDGRVREIFRKSYAPAERPMDHVAFALKYDGMNLDVLQKVFSGIATAEMAKYLEEAPQAQHSKRIGFLYEFLTGRELSVSERTGNYVPAIDSEMYVARRDSEFVGKWRVNNNLLGTAEFSPIIRRTQAVAGIEETDWAEMVASNLRTFSDETLSRAVSYLYFKETKSSFEIEREEPSPDRARRFVAMLKAGGQVENPFSAEALRSVQNAIVEPRFAEAGFRAGQNYIGESAAYFQEIVHSVGAPPAVMGSLMKGLEECFTRSEGNISPIIRAAALSFAFVFIHPFNDGNGRLHRFLLHDLLARGGVGGDGFLLPVSADILADMKSYDEALEGFSKPLMSIAEYEMENNGALTVTNPSELAGLFRFPDLTPQVEYLGNVLNRTINHSLPMEMEFIESLDRARTAVRDIVDMPDRDRERLLMRLHANSGALGKNRREKEFPFLTDNEVQDIEAAYKRAFSRESEEEESGGIKP